MIESRERKNEREKIDGKERERMRYRRYIERRERGDRRNEIEEIDREERERREKE